MKNWLIKQKVGLLITLILFGIGYIVYTQVPLEYNPRVKCYAAIQLLTGRPVDDICSEKEVTACGLTLKKCKTSLEYTCMSDMAVYTFEKYRDERVCPE